MKPIGPLMWEHRIIEKMIAVLKGQIRTVTEEGVVNVALIDQASDFFRTYADRTHHGKEEEILFRELEKKALSPELARMKDGLIEDHKTARKMVSDLLVARERYFTGSLEAAADVGKCLRKLVSFYPGHIEREDKHFFFPCLAYFSEDEQKKMLDKFYEFDRKMIHEKYARLLEQYLGQDVELPPWTK